MDTSNSKIFRGSPACGILLIIGLIYVLPKIGPWGGLNYLGFFSLLGFYSGFKMTRLGISSLNSFLPHSLNYFHVM